MIVGARWQAQLEQLPVAEAVHIAAGALRDGGIRLPLGLAVGFVVWGLWCWVTRAPWRSLGDALAVWAETMSVVGRNGCLLVGCCSGTVCPSWMAGICLRYPAGAEAHQGPQLREAVLDTGHPVEPAGARPAALFRAGGARGPGGDGVAPTTQSAAWVTPIGVLPDGAGDQARARAVAGAAAPAWVMLTVPVLMLAVGLAALAIVVRRNRTRPG